MKELIQSDVKRNYRVTAYELAEIAGMNISHATVPNVRAIIRELIDDGVPIGSDNEGYFMITERAQLEDVLGNLQSRCDAIQKRIVGITKAYNGVMNNRHTDEGLSMKDRCRYYVIYIAETSGIPYQAIWTMAYRKLQKITGVDLVNLPAWYQGSVLNYCVNKELVAGLYTVLVDLERSLI